MHGIWRSNKPALRPSLYEALWVELQKCANHIGRYTMQDIAHDSRDPRDTVEYSGTRFIIGSVYIVLAKRVG